MHLRITKLWSSAHCMIINYNILQVLIYCWRCGCFISFWDFKLEVVFFVGMDFHELLDIPQGDRRKYHDDVTVMVISLEGRIWKSSGKYLWNLHTQEMYSIQEIAVSIFNSSYLQAVSEDSQMAHFCWVSLVFNRCTV